MRFLYILMFSVCFSGAMAQRITITPGMEKMDDQYVSAFKVKIPYADVKAVEKEWKSLLKDNKASVSSSGSLIRGTNARISMITSDSLNIIARSEKDAEGVLFIAAFEINDEYISGTSAPAQGAMQLLDDFARPLARSAYASSVKDEEKKLKKLETDKSNLEKKNERLKRSIDKMKQKIVDYERDIKDNQTAIEGVNRDIDLQKQALENFRVKSDELTK